MPVGRTSQAMFRLIERLRALKASGRRVSVKTFEARVDLTFRQDYRELEMAQNLATIANSDPARPLVFVLTGMIGLCVTAAALRSRPYRQLTGRYAEQPTLALASC